MALRAICRLLGPKESLEKVMKYVRGDMDYVDFNNILPIPAELSSDLYPIAQEGFFILWYTENDMDEQFRIADYYQKISGFQIKLEDVLPHAEEYENEDNEGLKECARRYMENYDKYGYADSYQWCAEHWGTTDCYDTYADEDTLYFTVPYDIPTPVLLKLSSTFPEVTFSITFANDDESAIETAMERDYSNGEEWEVYINPGPDMDEVRDVTLIQYKAKVPDAYIKMLKED